MAPVELGGSGRHSGGAEERAGGRQAATQVDSIRLPIQVCRPRAAGQRFACVPYPAKPINLSNLFRLNYLI